MPRLIASIALMLAVLSTGGCATLFAGGPSTLEVEVRQPKEGVTIVVQDIDGKRANTYRQPAVRARIDRKRSYAVDVSAPGYEPRLIVISRSTHPAFWLNSVPLVLGGLSVTYGVIGSIAFGPETFVSGSVIGAAFGAVGLAGILVDRNTGNAWYHERRRLKVELEPRAR